MDRCEPNAVHYGMVSVRGACRGVGRMTIDDGYDYDRDDVDVRFRAVFWRGYVLGLLTVFALVGMMYV